MSVTVAKADGVTVFTLTSDPESLCPPMCQILKAFCCNPVCFTLSRRLGRVQRASQSVLGTLHIMVGLLNIGLGVILSDYLHDPVSPHWLGALFILFGIVSILSEKYPSPCLVVVSVILNLCAVGFAGAAIVIYSINVATIWIWMCEYDYYDHDYNDHTQSPHDKMLKDNCEKAKGVIEMLAQGMMAVLVVLSVLEFCVAISSAVMGIKALKNRENKNAEDAEYNKPLMEEVTNNP
ncbi:uncharacterized protein V6R79_010517 [Siganus canaliculatus]